MRRETGDSWDRAAESWGGPGVPRFDSFQNTLVSDFPTGAGAPGMPPLSLGVLSKSGPTRAAVSLGAGGRGLGALGFADGGAWDRDFGPGGGGRASPPRSLPG